MTIGSVSSDKSTIVRSFELPAPLRALSWALARTSPELAARCAEHLFLTVPRFRVPARERGWIEAAEAVRIGPEDFPAGSPSFAGRRSPLRGWSWGRGPTVLLSHGWAGRASQMGGFGLALADAGFRALAFDAPGHGTSGGWQSSLPAMSATLLAAERRFGRAVGYVGHSAGVAALLLAARGGLADRPGVFLAAPADMEAFLPGFAGVLGLPVEVAELMRQRIERRFQIRWDQLRPTGLVRWVGDAPLLVMSDSGDREVSWRDGEAIAAARPAARFERTVGLGHHRILRDPHVVDRAIAFLVQAVRRSEPRIAVAS